MGGFRRIVLAATGAVIVSGAWAGSAEATRPSVHSMVVRVVDEFGRPQQPATVIACPLIAGQFDCASPDAGVDVNRGGVGRLSLDSRSEYRLLAFVVNPEPAWACPGIMAGENELYLAEEPLEGLA